MKDVIAIAGVLLILGGTAIISIPAALIIAGLAVLGGTVLAAIWERQQAGTKDAADGEVS